MPTPIDRAMRSNNLFLGFAGLVTAVAAWSIWGQESMFPAGSTEPKGPPEQWTKEQMLKWLQVQKKVDVRTTESREELLAKVKDCQARTVK